MTTLNISLEEEIYINSSWTNICVLVNPVKCFDDKMNKFVMSKANLSFSHFFSVRIQLPTSEELETGSSSGHNADRLQHFYPWSL